MRKRCPIFRFYSDNENTRIAKKAFSDNESTRIAKACFQWQWKHPHCRRVLSVTMKAPAKEKNIRAQALVTIYVNCLRQAGYKLSTPRWLYALVLALSLSLSLSLAVYALSAPRCLHWLRYAVWTISAVSLSHNDSLSRCRSLSFSLTLFLSLSLKKKPEELTQS